MSVAPIGIPAPAVTPTAGRGRPAEEFAQALDVEAYGPRTADQADPADSTQLDGSRQRTSARTDRPSEPRTEGPSESREPAAESTDTGQAVAQARALGERGDDHEEPEHEDPAVAVLAALAQNAPTGQASEALTSALERIAGQTAATPPQTASGALPPAAEAILMQAAPVPTATPAASPVTSTGESAAPMITPVAAQVAASEAPVLPAATSAVPPAQAPGQLTPGAAQPMQEATAEQAVEVLDVQASGSETQSEFTGSSADDRAPEQPEARQSVAAVSVTPGAATARLLTGAAGVTGPLPAREVPSMVSQMAVGGGGRVTLALAPEGLGTIVVTVERLGDSVSVSVRGSAQAIAAIGHASISEALTSKGITSASVDLQAVTATRSASSGSSADQQPDSRSSDPRANTNTGQGQSRGRQQREQAHDDIYHFWS